ncbi:MAG: plasmid mobilization relaxosome protein MobC [Faecalibacterium sp.]
MEHKNRRLSIKLTQADWDAIHHKAAKANKNLTDYVTTVCLNKQIIIIDELKDFIKEQKAIGRNLNQLALLANRGRIETVSLTETAAQLKEINRGIQQMLERKRWRDGND